RFCRSVAADVIAHLSARRLNCLVDLARRYRESLSDDLKVIDEGLHLRLHFLAIGKYYFRSVNLHRTFGHTVQSLPYDPDGLTQFLNSADISGPHIAIC